MIVGACQIMLVLIRYVKDVFSIAKGGHYSILGKDGIRIQGSQKKIRQERRSKTCSQILRFLARIVSFSEIEIRGAGRGGEKISGYQKVEEISKNKTKQKDTNKKKTLSPSIYLPSLEFSVWNSCNFQWWRKTELLNEWWRTDG